MTSFLHFLGLLSALILSFVSSGMETALYRVSRVRMRIRADHGDARARWVNRVLDRMDGMVTGILINNNIAAYAATYFLTYQLTAWGIRNTELVTTAIVTPLFFVLTESLPKQLAYSQADLWALSLIRVFDSIRLLLSPMVWVLNRASSLLRRLFGVRGDARLSQSQRTLLLEHLNAGVAERVLSAEQNRMAASIMQLEGISAGDSMVPLSRLTLVSTKASRSRATAEMARHKSQLALLIDSTGKPTGHLVTLNALVMNPAEESSPVSACAENPVRIRAGAAIPEVLNLFRTRHARHALVLERNQVIGLITGQSVLDRIAGITR